jgi:hypothetical protein
MATALLDGWKDWVNGFDMTFTPGRSSIQAVHSRGMRMALITILVSPIMAPVPEVSVHSYGRREIRKSSL